MKSYRVLSLAFDTGRPLNDNQRLEFARALNAMSADGWDLVETRPTGAQTLAIFARAFEPPSPGNPPGPNPGT